MAQPFKKPQAHSRHSPPRSRIALTAAAALLACASAQAQNTTLKPVVITGQSAAQTADVTGFGDVDVPWVCVVKVKGGGHWLGEYLRDGDASLVRQRIEGIPGRLETIWAESESSGRDPASVADAMAQRLIGRG